MNGKENEVLYASKLYATFQMRLSITDICRGQETCESESKGLSPQSCEGMNLITARK